MSASWSSLRLSVCLGLLSGLLVSGCATSDRTGGRTTVLSAGSDAQPGNFHQSTAWLPTDVRRVAVLPLTAWSGDAIDYLTQARLERQLATELVRAELFELVIVDPAELRRWTGRSGWEVTDALPPDLLARLNEQLGCEGVMFAHVTAFRPHSPQSMGWRLHLVDTREPKVLWACDLFYDTGAQEVARSAVRYEKEHQAGRLPASDPATILRSPGRFGQFTLAASLETLQRPQKTSKVFSGDADSPTD
jgi:hypothetical protein